MALDSDSDWLDDRPWLWVAVAVLVPGGAYAASQLWLSDAALHSALGLGLVFGLVFAAVTAVGRRFAGD